MARVMPKTPSPTMDDDAIVHVIDDDASVREALGRLLRSVDLRTELYASANEILQRQLSAVPGCLVVDIRMPGLSGFELHAELTRANINIPIIFMTAYGDIPMSVRAMKGGAIDFLTKPFRDQDLLDAVTTAIATDRARRSAERTRLEMQQLFDSLTPREREVVTYVAAGLMNKQIAADIGISEVTIKIHRMNAMKKLQTKSLADLIRMAEILGIAPPKS